MQGPKLKAEKQTDIRIFFSAGGPHFAHMCITDGEVKPWKNEIVFLRFFAMIVLMCNGHSHKYKKYL